MINKLKEPLLRKILIILLIILVFLFIIKECKLIGFCFTIISLISPIFFGYVIAWLLKPIMFKFNRRFNLTISIFLTYLLISLILLTLGYFTIPIIIKEVKNIIPIIIEIYYKLPSNLNVNKLLDMLNNITNQTKTIILNIFYSIFISYFYLLSHKEVSRFVSKYLPSKLAFNISINLKAFVKGTLIDTLILFLMTFISFLIVKMPYGFLFAIIISLTNIIPYVGPYIGGIPATLVAFSVNNRVGTTILIIIILSQFIESTFIHPIIMSKSLKISPIYIIISLIICGYFFGLIGMVISTPLVSIIKTTYDYYKKKKLN